MVHNISMFGLAGMGGKLACEMQADGRWRPFAGFAYVPIERALSQTHDRFAPDAVVRRPLDYNGDIKVSYARSLVTSVRR